MGIDGASAESKHLKYMMSVYLGVCNLTGTFIIEEKYIENGVRRVEACILKRKEALDMAEKEFKPDLKYNMLESMALKNCIRIRRADLRAMYIIGEQAFQNCTSVREVYFQRLLRVQKEAFHGCVNLKEVVFPHSLRELGRRSFSECKRLRRVEFQEPSKCQEIPDRAFYKCESLEEIILSSRLKRIGREAFYQAAIEEIALPEELESIGESAFLKCKMLREVKIPASVEEIGKWAFHGCNRLEILEIHHTPRFLGDWITNKACVIRCPKGSKMEAYARNYGMKVEYCEVEKLGK